MPKANSLVKIWPMLTKYPLYSYHDPNYPTTVEDLSQVQKYLTNGFIFGIFPNVIKIAPDHICLRERALSLKINKSHMLPKFPSHKTKSFKTLTQL